MKIKNVERPLVMLQTMLNMEEFILEQIARTPRRVSVAPLKEKFLDVELRELPSRIRMWDFTPETLLERLKAVTTGSTTGMSSEKKKV